MKKLLIIAVCAGLVFGIYGLCFGQGETLKGYFITTAGKTQVVGEFIGIKGHDKYRCSYEDNAISIPYSDIKSMTYLGGGFLLLKKRNGKEFKVKGFMLNITYTFYDNINDKYSTDSIRGNSIKQIVFDEDYGSQRKCPKCGKTFLPDYMFCPYDKTDLELIRLGPQSKNIPPKKRKKYMGKMETDKAFAKNQPRSSVVGKVIVTKVEDAADLRRKGEAVALYCEPFIT